MKRVGGLCLLLFGAAGLFAQNRGGTSGSRGGSAPVVVNHSGGRTGAGAIPGIPTPGSNILYPGLHPAPPVHRNPGAVGTGVFAYPVYVPVPYSGYYGGGYYDNSYANPYVSAPPDPSMQQNMMMYPPAYPPETAQSRTYINPNVDQDSDSGPPTIQPDNSAASHFLIAMKDHTIYAAVAYYVDGDTLHYFTDGNVHNQVSIASVDRDLTDRLNQESGKRVNLTPTK